MEDLGRIFSAERDDLLLLEDGLDPPYLRHAESETAPQSPHFLPSQLTFSTNSSSASHLTETLSSPFNFLSLPLPTTSVPVSVTPTPPPTSPLALEQNNFHLQHLLFSVTTSPSTSSSSGTSNTSPEFSTSSPMSEDGLKAGGMSEDFYAEAACEVCYKAKRSCDRRVPCGRCVRLSRTHLCIQRIRKAPRPRKLKEPRPNFLTKRPSELQISSSWGMPENKNKIPRLAPHHIVTASIVPSQDLKLSSSTSQLVPPPTAPPLTTGSSQLQTSQTSRPPTHSPLTTHPISHSHQHTPQPVQVQQTAEQLQSIQQMLGIELDWLPFFVDDSSISGTLLPLISLASKSDEAKWGANLQYPCVSAFALRTHEEKWITTWHDTISSNKDALNKSGFLMKFDRVTISYLQNVNGSIQELLLSMFQTQERELFKNIPPHPPPLTSSSTSSPSSPSSMKQELSSSSSSTLSATPLPLVSKGYAASHCDLHATIVIQWSQKEAQDGVPSHVTLEVGSNKEMQRLFGYESRELEDSHIFPRLLHPKDWSTLISKICSAWIKGSTYMAMFVTCINKRYIEFPCLLEFRSTVIREEQAMRVYCFFIPVPTTP